MAIAHSDLGVPPYSVISPHMSVSFDARLMPKAANPWVLKLLVKILAPIAPLHPCTGLKLVMHIRIVTIDPEKD